MVDELFSTFEILTSNKSGAKIQLRKCLGICVFCENSAGWFCSHKSFTIMHEAGLFFSHIYLK